MGSISVHIGSPDGGETQIISFEVKTHQCQTPTPPQVVATEQLRQQGLLLWSGRPMSYEGRLFRRTTLEKGSVVFFGDLTG